MTSCCAVRSSEPTCRWAAGQRWRCSSCRTLTGAAAAATVLHPDGALQATHRLSGSDSASSSRSTHQIHPHSEQHPPARAAAALPLLLLKARIPTFRLPAALRAAVCWAVALAARSRDSMRWRAILPKYQEKGSLKGYGWLAGRFRNCSGQNAGNTTIPQLLRNEWHRQHNQGQHQHIYHLLMMLMRSRVVESSFSSQQRVSRRALLLCVLFSVGVWAHDCMHHKLTCISCFGSYMRGSSSSIAAGHPPDHQQQNSSIMMSLQGMGQCSGSVWVPVLATEGGELWQTRLLRCRSAGFPTQRLPTDHTHMCTILPDPTLPQGEAYCCCCCCSVALCTTACWRAGKDGLRGVRTLWGSLPRAVSSSSSCCSRSACSSISHPCLLGCAANSAKGEEACPARSACWMGCCAGRCCRCCTKGLPGGPSPCCLLPFETHRCASAAALNRHVLLDSVSASSKHVPTVGIPLASSARDKGFAGCSLLPRCQGLLHRAAAASTTALRASAARQTQKSAGKGLPSTSRACRYTTHVRCCSGLWALLFARKRPHTGT